MEAPDFPYTWWRGPIRNDLYSLRVRVMQSYPARALDRKLQVDWARDEREGPRVIMSLRLDFGPIC